MTMDDMFSDQIEDDANASSGPVTCLGRTFENDGQRGSGSAPAPISAIMRA